MATDPRISPPGTIWMITQRVTTGQFWFRPDPIIEQTFLYVLALRANPVGIKIHLATVLSNHFHIVLTDVLGDQIQAFNRDFMSLLAIGVNRARDRRGNLLDPAGVNCVDICPAAETLVDRATYVSNNAVNHGLVPYARKWPGVNLLPQQMGLTTLVVPRPSFFSARFPEVVELQVTIPEAVDVTPEELRRLMCDEHKRKERAKRQEMADKGKRFLGRKRVLRQSVRSSPEEDPRSRRKPPIACLDQELRRRMLEWREERRVAYRAVLMMVRRGFDNLVFPLGTWFQHFLCGRHRRPWDGSIWVALMSEP